METTFSNRRPTHKLLTACVWRQRECGTNGLIRFGGNKVNEKTGEMPYGFASKLCDALPNASFIGFTGTPIEKTDANTQAVSGCFRKSDKAPEVTRRRSRRGTSRYYD